MELDDLKGAWAQYDKKLSENLKFNEELLRKMNLSKAKQELQKPLNTEIISIIIIFLSIVFVMGFSLRLIDEIQYSIPGFAGVVIGIAYLIFSITKVNKFTKIDYYNTSIVQLQKELLLLNNLILRFRKLELILLPFLVIAILPIAFKATHNINIYERLGLFILEAGFILGISIAVGFWVNKIVYDKKLKDAKMFLKEIENFEKVE